MAQGQSTDQLRRAARALDAANFFLADVRQGLGPYLAIYLLTEQRWDEAKIGVVMSVATIAGIVAQTPAGALVDATRAKRLIMALAALIVTVASLLLPLFQSFWLVAISQSIAVSIYAAWSVLRVSPWLVKATSVESRFDPRSMPGDLRCRLVKRREVTGSDAWTSKP